MKRPLELSEEQRQEKLQEKEDHEAKRQKLGISKNQYKKLLKQQKQEETKEEYRRNKREKRKENKAKAKESKVEKRKRSQEN